MIFLSQNTNTHTSAGWHSTKSLKVTCHLYLCPTEKFPEQALSQDVL